MAVVTVDTTQHLRRSTGCLDFTANYTAMAWAFCTTTPTAGNNKTAYLLGVEGFYLDAIGMVNTAGTLNLWLINNGVSNLFQQATGSVALSGSTWMHLTLVRTDTTHLLGYLNGVLDATLTHTDLSTGRGTTNQEIIGGDHWDGRVAAYKSWTRALTAAEVAQEYALIRPTAPANLWQWTPMFPASGERVRDYSGNGRDWSEIGTPTDGDPPPVSYGAPTLWAVPRPLQYARPASDISAGTWTASTGTDLYAMLDEVVADDADYDQSATTPTSDVMEVKLGAVTDPAVSTGHVLRVRLRKPT